MNRPDLSKIKDKGILEYIVFLENQLKSPYAESFVSLKKMIDKGNAQIKESDIDIFTPEGETKFKQASKFSSQLKDWFEQLDYFKSRMTPDEIKSAEGVIEKASIDKKVGFAEKIALKESGKGSSI